MPKCRFESHSELFFFHVYVFNSALYEYRNMSANNGAQLLPREFQLIVKRPDFQKLLSCCQSETQPFLYIIFRVVVYIIQEVFNKNK